MMRVEMQVFDRRQGEVRLIFEGWFGCLVARLFWLAASRCSPTYAGGSYGYLTRPYDEGIDDWAGCDVRSYSIYRMVRKAVSS